MNISVVTPIWGRSELTKAVLDYYNELKIEGLIYEHIVVGSTIPDLEIAQSVSHTVVVDHANDPLGEKFNAGIDLAFRRSPEVDAVMISGSDAVVSRPYLKLLSVLMGSVPWVQAQSLYLLEERGGTADIWYWDNLLTGTGQCISRETWQKFEGPTYDSKNKALDASLYRRMAEHDIKPVSLSHMDGYGVAVLTIKLSRYDDNQITSTQEIMERHPAFFQVADGPIDCGEWIDRNLHYDLARTIFSMIYA